MCHALAVPGYISEWLHWPKWSKKSSVSRMISRKKPRSSEWVTSSFITTPSMGPIDFTSSLVVRAISTYEVVHRVIRLDGFPRVTPETIEHVVFHQPPLDIPVVDVCDLELAAARGLEVWDYLPDGVVVEIDARYCVGAWWIRGLFHDALDSPVAIQLGYAKVPEMLVIALA